MEVYMSKLKLMTIIGTRPEIIKLSEIIKKCDEFFDHIIVHTGQNYDYSLNQIFFEDLGLREPDYYLNVVGENLGETIGNIITKSYELIDELKPEALLILGDTNSGLSVISAKRLKVPVFHLEAGNRCFDENLPEEINRKIIDHTSDINLCYTEHARRYLFNEGISKERVFVIGSPMIEVIEKHKEKIENSKILESYNLEKGKYIVLSAHREENIDNPKNFACLIESINSIANFYNIPIIYSLHPRSKKMIEQRGVKLSEKIKPITPLSFSDYITLQKKSFCVLSDSGTLAEEASIFKFPAISLRTSTERPEAIDKGNFVIGNLKTDSILQAINMVTQLNSNGKIGQDVPDYTDSNVSTKVVKIIQSYTSLVNLMVWRKD